MKCYYEELWVARDASDGEIKAAYRKLALRWHPDKNLNNSEEAKSKFQTLQQAYEVLSDAHERAWYDNHREQILRGKKSDYEENCLDLFQFFTVSCFKGYDDDDKGFYKTYANVFEKIAAEDAEFMDDEEQIENIPKFGDSTSSYEDVVGPFYAYWQSYCTKKTYTWLCPHDIAEIKDRRVLRYIEKDMKKIVQQAKRERNEEVRNLLSFIRKRDRRVQANKKLLEEKAALNRQKQEQNRLKQIRERNREVEEMRKTNSNIFNVCFEEQLKQLEQEYADDTEDEEDYEDLNSDQDEQTDCVNDLYCVACHTAFANENSFMNHETSKKHKENVEKLLREMKDEYEYFEDLDNQNNGIQIVELEDLDDIDDMSEDISDQSSNIRDVDDGILTPDLYDELNDLEIEDHDQQEQTAQEKIHTSSKKSKGKKNKKANKALQIDKENFDVLEITEQIKPPAEEKEKEASDSDDEWAKGKKSNKRAKNKKSQKKLTTTTASSSQPIENEFTQEPSNGNPFTDTTHTCTCITCNYTFTPNFYQLYTEEQSKYDLLTDTTHTCITCKYTFTSKKKLFAHLKKTNHGVYIPKAKTPSAAEIQPTKKSKAKRK